MAKKIITRVREQFTTFLKVECFICGKTIGKIKRYYIGQEKWRHWRCEAGSESWRASKHYRTSNLKEYYK